MSKAISGQPVDEDGQAFNIYALSVGGGLLALCPMPGGAGNYDRDMAFVRDWRPGLVLSMTTKAEHRSAGAEGLGVDFQSMGCGWSHLPVADFGVPDAEVGRIWPAVSAAARQTLLGGGRVLVHCRGGCGRSGMAVLRLMIESGEDAEHALSRLRQMRPCAVETEAQMTWAIRGG